MADFSFSVLTPVARATADDSALVQVLEKALGGIGTKDQWKVVEDGHWCYAARPDQVGPAQGWKLHVSATMASAETVLTRALPVLLDGGSPFKFARTIDHVALMNTRQTPRGHSGKFITVYPYDDDEAVRLAAALHEATVGLPGPRILSDNPYMPMSLVHYRYGAFVEERKISNDGFYTWTILDPDGNPVEDRRVGQYVPPAWARCPFPQPAGSGAARTNGTSATVLLADRFAVREAIRHSNKGGVYRAVDTRSGAAVVIKEARPHVAANEAGRDARDLLRAEARALEVTGPVGLAPRMLDLFEQGQHLFLAEEQVPGISLREWVPELIRRCGWSRHVPEALDQAERLVELMAATHQAGLILRDFNPNNIMVLPDGQLRLIDLELAVVAAQPGEDRVHVGTLGFSSPEQMAGAEPAFEADYYSLGATICFVLTGDNPYFLNEVPPSRTVRQRLAEWLGVRAEVMDLRAGVQELILALMDQEPERRLTPDRARAALAAARAAAPPCAPVDVADVARRDGSAKILGEEQCQQVIDGMVNYLLASMTPDEGERLWPVSCAFGAPDPCSIQLGATGILGTLTRYLELTGDPRVAEAVATAGRWIAARVGEGSTRPPGLYFGNAGIAWTLYDAGRAVDDGRLVEQALALAETLPVSWSSPDVMQGSAGIGLALLHLGQRTGDSAFAERAGRAAEGLLASIGEEEGEIIWSPPAEFDSRLAGRRYYGFAHGSAGVGYFLLAVALATGRPDLRALAVRVGDSLLGKATVIDDVAHWGPGPGDAPTAPYWCHGASGIGSFLTRLHAAGAGDRFGHGAQMSARAVAENVWRGSLGQCHGLAGNGEFLLDIARSMPETPFLAGAHQLARALLTTRVRRGDQLVVPNEHQGVSATWGDGVSGVLSFFLRLRHGSQRLWMVDASPERGELS